MPLSAEPPRGFLEPAVCLLEAARPLRLRPRACRRAARWAGLKRWLPGVPEQQWPCAISGQQPPTSLLAPAPRPPPPLAQQAPPAGAQPGARAAALPAPPPPPAPAPPRRQQERPLRQAAWSVACAAGDSESHCVRRKQHSLVDAGWLGCHHAENPTTYPPTHLLPLAGTSARCGLASSSSSSLDSSSSLVAVRSPGSCPARQAGSRVSGDVRAAGLQALFEQGLGTGRTQHFPSSSLPTHSAVPKGQPSPGWTPSLWRGRQPVSP